MSTEAERRSIGRIFYRFVAGLLCSSFVIYLAGNAKPPYPGCGREHGWPLVYYHEAGLIGDAAWIWNGLAGDVALSILISMGFALLWSMVAQFAKAKADEG